MTLKVFLLSLVLALALACATLYSSIDRHELAHKTINEYYGAESDYKITLSAYEINGQTQAADYSSDQDRQLAYVGHSMNEAVGYQLQPFIFVVVFLLSLHVFYSVFNNLEANA